MYSNIQHKTPNEKNETFYDNGGIFEATSGICFHRVGKI